MNNQVIKEGSLFYLCNERGDLVPEMEQGHGLYWKDTRFLSQLRLLVNQESPVLLGSHSDKSYLLSTLLMKETKDRGAIEVRRETFIHEGTLYERLAVTNFYLEANHTQITLQLDADFQDMFIVRQYRTGEVGHTLEPSSEQQSIMLRYLGKDAIERGTKITWDYPAAQSRDLKSLSFSLALEPEQTQFIHLHMTPMHAGQPSSGIYSFTEALQRLEESYQQWSAGNTTAVSSNEHYNQLFNRSLQDSRMLMDNIGQGPIPVAGLPWFAVPFGRDNLITSLFMLLLNPSHAVGTLRTLAAYQGTKLEAWRDEEPGKIMHEIRFGELTATKQSPFSPYYGGVDSTPLFLILLVEYVRWSGDTPLVEELQPNIDAALQWIDTRCANHPAHFLTYHQEASEGFPNQGWKDSSNSIIHENGQYAKSPLALVEVQGYIYSAKNGLAAIYEAMNKAEQAERLRAEAESLKEQFQHYYWMEQDRFYSIALDESLQQVKSITSNPGHLLMSDILDAGPAKFVAERLLQNDLFNGYGVRTMSSQATGYYPMSYHNGSVWPHDNGMILLGLLRYNHSKEAMRIVSGMLQVAKQSAGYRLPELLCGYDLMETNRMVPYPTPCSPQAWAGATAFVMLQAMLGLMPNTLAGKIALSPALPTDMNQLTVGSIRIGKGILSLKLERDSEDTSKINVEILTNTTELRIEIEPNPCNHKY